MATKYDESEVSRIVEASFGNKNYGQLLEGFLGIADEIISARAPIVFRSFVHHIKKTYDPEHIALFSDNQRSIDLLNKLLATAGIDEASLLIREAVDNFDLEDFIAFRSFIIRQECACGRNGFEKNTLNAQLIDLETLEFVEQKLIQKTQESMNELSILGKEDAQGLLHIWERINPESYDHCLRQALNHPLGKVLLAQLYVSKWYGSHSNGWTIDKGFKVFVTEEKALAGIREAVLQEDFWSLPHSTIERTAAFAIGVENKQYEMNANEINESIVNERIRNWEKNRHLRNE